MKKLVSFLALAVMGIGFISGAHAADASTTIVVRDTVTPLGMIPQVGVVQATVAATPTSIFDIPGGINTNKLLMEQCTTYDSDGTIKPLTAGRFSRTISVTSSAAPSGTIAIGDIIKCTFVQQP